MQNSDDHYRNIAIALAGIAQAIDVMNKLARTGYLNRKDFATCVSSLFEQNPADAESVFGGIINLERGFSVLIDLLKNRRDMEHAAVINYGLGIFHLQRKLSSKPWMLNKIGDRLDQARHQVKHFGTTHENVIANLASVYTDTISTFPFRIQVIGEYQYLQQQRIADQVRVLLMAAVRSATLWKQVGGNRLQLFFQRSKILAASESLLDEIKKLS